MLFRQPLSNRTIILSHNSPRHLAAQPHHRSPPTTTPSPQSQIPRHLINLLLNPSPAWESKYTHTPSRIAPPNRRSACKSEICPLVRGRNRKDRAEKYQDSQIASITVSWVYYSLYSPVFAGVLKVSPQQLDTRLFGLNQTNIIKFKASEYHGTFPALYFPLLR